MDLRSLIGRKVQWSPSGRIIPVTDDTCVGVPCRGEILEVGRGDNSGLLEVSWETICNQHESQSPGNSGRKPTEWHWADDLALI
jgi:hypothetical protein